MREALAVVRRHAEAAPTCARLAQLLRASLEDSELRIALPAEPLLMRVQGGVGLLLACGFETEPPGGLRLARGAARQSRDLAIGLLVA